MKIDFIEQFFNCVITKFKMLRRDFCKRNKFEFLFTLIYCLYKLRFEYSGAFFKLFLTYVSMMYSYFILFFIVNH